MRFYLIITLMSFNLLPFGNMKAVPMYPEKQLVNIPVDRSSLAALLRATSRPHQQSVETPVNPPAASASTPGLTAVSLPHGPLYIISIPKCGPNIISIHKIKIENLG
jgi:hypothetical protein